MSTYVYYTPHFEGSICHDGSLNIKHVTAGALEKDKRKVLNLSDFIKTTKQATHAQQLLQHVLSHFSWSFKKNQTHRDELKNILRYFVIAEHYKLLIPQDVANKKIEALSRDYEKIKTSYPNHCDETHILNLDAQNKHINPPLVGSIGIIVFATVDYVWIVQENQTLNPNKPEYLYNLYEQHKVYGYNTIYTETQDKCIAQVMTLQKEYYGFNLETVVAKNAENKMLFKTLQELELILKIPEPDTYGYAEKQKAKEEEEKVLQQETQIQLENMRKGFVDKLVIP